MKMQERIKSNTKCRSVGISTLILTIWNNNNFCRVTAEINIDQVVIFMFVLIKAGGMKEMELKGI